MRNLKKITIFCFFFFSSQNAISVENVNVFSEKDGHPCLMFSVDEIPDIVKRAESTEWTKALMKSIIDDSERFMKHDNVPFKITSDEYSIATCGRALGNYVVNLAFTGYITKDIKYIERAKEILISAVKATIPGTIQSNDHKSDAMQRALDGAKRGEPQHWLTHLQNGDAGQSMALGYDLLYPFMNEDELKLVKDELYQMGEYLYNNAGFYNNYLSTATACNHNSVHHGALGLISLMLGDRPEWYEKALKFTDGYYVYAADDTGYIMEGHSYQGYGMTGAYPFTHALKRLKNIDLTDKFDSFFSEYGEQNLWKLLPNGHMLTMNDSRDEQSDESAVIGAIIKNKPVQLWAWLKSAGYYDTNKIYPANLRAAYSRAFLLLVGDNPVEPIEATSENTPLQKHFSSGRVFMRSGWESVNDSHFGFTSGYDGHRGHNHRDENHVTFSALGEQFLFDTEYEGNESFFHSIVSINGTEQSYLVTPHGTQGNLQIFRQNKDWGFVKGEAKTAYPDSCNIEFYNRKAMFVRNAPFFPYIVIRDDIQLKSKSEVDCVARYVTHPKNTISYKGNGVVINGCYKGNKALVLAYTLDKPLKLKQDNLKNDYMIVKNSRKLDYDRLIKRFSGKVKAVNPVITTIVLPFEDEKQLPMIDVKRVKNDLFYTLKFSNGSINEIRLTSDDIYLLY